MVKEEDPNLLSKLLQGKQLVNSDFTSLYSYSYSLDCTCNKKYNRINNNLNYSFFPGMKSNVYA